MRPEIHLRTMPLHPLPTVTVPELSERSGVQADLQPRASASTGVGLRTQTISVVTDATPSALARIFVLLATLNLVPVATRSASPEQGSIDLCLSFENVGGLRIDLLCRKLLQLTETISVNVTERQILS